MMAALLGAGPVADAFLVAFKLPNFFRRLFGEGAFNNAFVPIFSGLLAASGRPAALAFAEGALILMILSQAVISVIAELAMPYLVMALAPGFIGDPLRFDLAVELTRITFPYLMLMSLAALFSGVLNAMDRFAAAAATPVLLNLCLMAAMATLPPLFPTVGHALAWGVVAAGIVQFIWLAVALARADAALRLPMPRLDPPLRKLNRLMIPGAIGAGVVQINVMVDVVLASLLPTGAVSYLYYADRVAQLPLGVVGTAIGTALLPLLSRQLKAGDLVRARDSQARAMEMALALTLPAAVGLMLLSQMIIATLFERGAFGPAESAATGAALAAFAAGLPAYVIIKVLTPGFYAREDTATPLKIALATVAVNIALTVLLMQSLAHVGIALGTALAAWLNAAVLALVLARRGHFATDPRLIRRSIRILTATAIMAAGLWAAQTLVPIGSDADLLRRALGLLALIVWGGLLYLGAAQLLGGLDLRDLKRLIQRAPIDAPPSASP
jgi:putative peptidoglycan lipid II flippase